VEAIEPGDLSVASVGIAIHCSEELGPYACTPSGNALNLFSGGARFEVFRGFP
jgi:hypothetical protein